MKKILLALALMASALFGQQTHDFSTDARVLPFPVRNFIPGQCQPGEIFRLTLNDTDDQTFFCKARNTWEVLQALRPVSAAPTGACVQLISPLFIVTAGADIGKGYYCGDDLAWHVAFDPAGIPGADGMNGMDGAPGPASLPGTTAAIGGMELTDDCVTGTAAVTGVDSTMAIVVTPAADPGVGVSWVAFMSGMEVVTVRVCVVGTVTPASVAYNVRAIQ